MLYEARGINASAKPIDPHQPAQFAQADLDRNLLHLVFSFFFMSKDQCYLWMLPVFWTKQTFVDQYFYHDQLSTMLRGV